MADITTIPLARHLRGSETTWVRHTRRGREVHQGRGQSFWFRPLSAAVSEVPVDEREQPMLFHARTSDHQDVTVQATVTFWFAHPELAADRLDFGIDTATGTWRADPLSQVAGLLTETAQQHALATLARRPLADVLAEGVDVLREAIVAGLVADHRIEAMGLVVVDVRVVALRAEPEVERALQTPARELIQQAADAATYARRATAVERERAIAENEVQSRIELARREQELVGQRGANLRREAEEAALASAIEARATLERDQLVAEGRATTTREVGLAAAQAEAAHVAVYADLPASVLTALAVKELAGNLPAISSLVLTPDLLAPVLARLAAAGES